MFSKRIGELPVGGEWIFEPKWDGFRALPSPDEIARTVAHEERIARENPAYVRIGGDECGRYNLAGKAIAVPFVGAIAATLVIAEAIRLFHRGQCCRTKGDIESALLDYTEAIRLKPDYGEAFFNRGVARLAKGDLEG